MVGCPNWGPAAARGAGSGSPGGGSSAGGGHASDNGGGGGSRGKAASGAAAAASFEARLRYPTGTRCAGVWPVRGKGRARCRFVDYAGRSVTSRSAISGNQQQSAPWRVMSVDEPE